MEHTSGTIPSWAEKAARPITLKRRDGFALRGAATNGRAGEVLALCRTAYRLTNARWEEKRKVRKVVFTVGAILGLVGLGGFAYFSGHSQRGADELILKSAAACLTLFPIALCAWQAFIHSTAEGQVGALAEVARQMTSQARTLVTEVDAKSGGGSKEPDDGVTRSVFLDVLERAARDAITREWTARGTTDNARRHTRIKPSNDRTTVQMNEGRLLKATITDMSMSGVALEGNLPGIDIGATVTIGSRKAKAVRMLSRGMAFEFAELLPQDDFGPDFLL